MAFGSPQWMYASGGDYYEYKIPYSMRFDNDDTTYLTRTPSSAGNRRTWTYSAWFKASSLAADHGNSGSIFEAYGDDSNRVRLYFDDGSGLNPLSFYCKNGGSLSMRLLTTQGFRDFSAWYHIVLAVDTTQGTNTNRVKLYVNGEQITSFSSATYPSQNEEFVVNTTNIHHIGVGSYSGSLYGGTYYDGYIAEAHFIDGTALTPSSFGETGDYGEWKPIEVEGLTYGTNGFYLSFAGGGVMSATGGNSTATDGDYKAASFTSDGTFTPSADGFVEYLVIAGGGGGGHADGGNLRAGGGGGAGGYRTGYLSVTGGTGYSITVGDGGAGASGAYTGTSEAGDNSVFSSITSTGGGGGKGHTESADTSTGGSGGGGSWSVSRTTGGSASPAGQGNAGGAGGDSHPIHGGGGGGGAGAVGAARSSGTGGAGGAGLASSITGSSVTRAGGGGGAGTSTGGAGGSGGGGAGQSGTSGSGGTNGTANTGGGGGAASDAADAGGTGGSGIVILRYKFQ